MKLKHRGSGSSSRLGFVSAFVRGVSIIQTGAVQHTALGFPPALRWWYEVRPGLQVGTLHQQLQHRAVDAIKATWRPAWTIKRYILSRVRVVRLSRLSQVHPDHMSGNVELSLEDFLSLRTNFSIVHSEHRGTWASFSLDVGTSRAVCTQTTLKHSCSRVARACLALVQNQGACSTLSQHKCIHHTTDSTDVSDHRTAGFQAVSMATAHHPLIRCGLKSLKVSAWMLHMCTEICIFVLLTQQPVFPQQDIKTMGGCQLSVISVI